MPLHARETSVNKAQCLSGRLAGHSEGGTGTGRGGGGSRVVLN